MTVTDPMTRAFLDSKDPGREATQCVRMFADDLGLGNTHRRIRAVSPS